MGEEEDYIPWRLRQRTYEKGLDGSLRLDPDPRRPSLAWDIAWRAAWRFAFNRVQRRDDVREYFGAAQVAVCKLLRRNKHAPDSWIFTVAWQAVLTSWQRSNLIPIPATTRARWVEEGREFEDFDRLSYQFVYDASDTLRDAVLREHPHWESPTEIILQPPKNILSKMY